MVSQAEPSLAEHGWHGSWRLETDIYVAILDIDRIGVCFLVQAMAHRGFNLPHSARARLRQHSRTVALSMLARVACSRAAVRLCDCATQERALTKCGGIPASLPSGRSSNQAAASFRMRPSSTRGGAR